jgi:hypothetical protein
MRSLQISHLPYGWQIGTDISSNLEAAGRVAILTMWCRW